MIASQNRPRRFRGIEKGTMTSSFSILLHKLKVGWCHLHPGPAISNRDRRIADTRDDHPTETLRNIQL